MQASPLNGLDEISFENSITWPIQLAGRADAQAALAYGPGYGWDDYIW